VPLTVLSIRAAVVSPTAPAAAPWSLAADGQREALAAGSGWRLPLPGQPDVVRGFDPPDAPWASGHRGVDLAAPPGTPVLAAGPGVVSYAAVLAGRGVVAIQHAGGLRTTYEPLVVTTAVGHRVAAGEIIGTLLAGHPGCPRIACLHWGLLRADHYLDPLALIRSAPIRLLPLTDAPDHRPLPSGPRAAPAPAAGTATDPPAGRWDRLRSASTAAALGLGVVGMLAIGRRRPP
jgi:murein DD-endopeptidase MepM/ murein hydrolase activator NlpD